MSAKVGMPETPNGRPAATAGANDDMSLPQSPHPALAERDADLYARFFRALGDPTRVRLLHLLVDAPAGECSVSELVAALGAPQSRVSTHLGCLRWCGLVETRRAARQVYYRVADPRVRELLVLSGAVLHDHAAGVASCGLVG